MRMPIIKKYIKKLRNAFHIPGEDVIILGFDDRCKTARIYDLYVKTGSRFSSKLESKEMEGNRASPWLWLPRLKLPDIFTGHHDKDDPNILHISFDVDKREGCIFKTEDKPEGVMYPFDMTTGEGVEFVRRIVEVPKPSTILPNTDPTVTGLPALPETSSIEDLLEPVKPTATVTTTISQIPAEYADQVIPRQIRLKRDPVLDILVSVNPFMIGSMIDSFIATELLRGKVEVWKTVVIAIGAGIMGLVIGMGLK